MLRNIFKVFLSNIVIIVIGFINGLIFPKLLSIDDYAVYQTFLLYGLYIGILPFGFPSGLFVKYGGKSYANVDKKQYKSEIRFILLSQLILTIVCILIAIYLKNDILFYTALCIIPVNLVGSYKALYQAWNQFNKLALINTLISIAPCLVMVVAYWIAKRSDARLAIFPYIIINLLCCIFILYSFQKDTRKVKSNKVLSRDNMDTLKIGFFLMIGNAVSIVLCSMDRFFVKALFTSYEFAMYSFALSMQAMINIFITAVSQPLYPKMASEQVTTKAYSFLKELLLALGSLSGCVYFACSIIVKWFLPHYVESLKVMSIFFAIFPAVAVINCLYVNLYKITGQIKKYIVTIGMMVAIFVALNIAAISIYKNFLSVSFAMTIGYYIWLWYSSKHFEHLTLTKRDSVFLSGFLILFFVTTRFLEDISGLTIYSICIIIWIALIYKGTSTEILKIILGLMRK